MDVLQGQQGFSPAYQINPDLNAMAATISSVRQEIRDGFFNDLFMMMINSGTQMTAREVAERHEEKLLLVGSVIERAQPELLDKIIDRTYSILESNRMIPPPPKEIEGVPITVEYISLLAQAQKMVGTNAIEQFSGYVGRLAAVNPSIMDKVDMDQAVDEYGDMMGVPARIIRSDEEVKKIRDARAQQEQMAQQQAMLAQAANSAKVLSETPTTGNTALTALTGVPGAI